MNLTVKILASLLLLTTVHGFAPRPLSSVSTRLHYKDAKDSSSLESKDVLDVMPTTMPGEVSPRKVQQPIDMERLKNPRPYPLFVAEKVAGMVDGVVRGAIKQQTNLHEPVSTKERVVVLGSGWGAASFIAELDPDLYDITVVSPRNHFIFTPFLAGSSVGSVEYRSICEPIREVSIQRTTNDQN
jgi:hypothetical protein